MKNLLGIAVALLLGLNVEADQAVTVNPTTHVITQPTTSPDFKTANNIVNTSTAVNGHALTGNVTVTASDVSAIPLSGSTAITGALGANSGATWEISSADGSASFSEGSVLINGDGSAFFCDGNALIYGDGVATFYGGIADQYGNPLLDSADQYYYGYGAGVALDNQGQIWWSNYNFTPTVALDNLNQYHYGDGGVMTTYDETLYADNGAITLGDGEGDGSARFANGNVEISPSGDFYLYGGLFDNTTSRGAAGQVLESTGSGVQWTSPTTRSVVATDITCATGTTLATTSWSITLTPGTYDFEVVVNMTTASTTGGINGQFDTTPSDSGMASLIIGPFASAPQLVVRNLSQPSSGTQFADVNVAAPGNNCGSLARGRLVVAATTTYYWQASQSTTTDASNPPILKAGSYISCTRE
jgi:hypothetical protein